MRLQHQSDEFAVDFINLIFPATSHQGAREGEGAQEEEQRTRKSTGSKLAGVFTGLQDGFVGFVRMLCVFFI